MGFLQDFVKMYIIMNLLKEETPDRKNYDKEIDDEKIDDKKFDYGEYEHKRIDNTVKHEKKSIKRRFMDLMDYISCSRKYTCIIVFIQKIIITMLTIGACIGCYYISKLIYLVLPYGLLKGFIWGIVGYFGVYALIWIWKL